MIRVFNQYTSFKAALCALCEALAIVCAPWLAAQLRFWSDPDLLKQYVDSSDFLVQNGIFVAALLISFYYHGLYDLRKPVLNNQILGLIQAMGTASVILGALSYLLPGLLIGRGVFFLSMGIVGVMVIITRVLGAAIWEMAAPIENTIILGTGILALDVAREFAHRRDLATKLIGFIETEESVHTDRQPLGYPVLGTMDQLEQIVATRQVHRIVVALEDRRGVLPIRQLVKLRVQGAVVEEAQCVLTALTGHVRLQTLQPSWLVFSDGFHRSKITLAIKRILDLGFSIIGLLLSLPIMALVALAVRLDSKGPILYRQQRIGKQGRRFEILKFRSMRTDAEAGGAQWAQAGDTRVTRVGKIIRRLRLDELPQFINVIRGDMSFVGPRPERPIFVDQLSERAAYYEERHSVRPGLTGWAQVQYRYGATMEDGLMKLEYDLFYLKNMSVLFDVLIILKTIRTVMDGEGSLPEAAPVNGVRKPATMAASPQAKSASA